jgi:Protein of unknown function (DUF1153)
MEAMNKKTWPKAKYVVRRDGSLLTLGDLPSAKTIRWVISRKTIVVDAVRGGLISLEDACWRYSLTLEEFSAWQTAVDRRRRRALTFMPMMPPDTDLKKRLRNLRSLEEARAAYLKRTRDHQQTRPVPDQLAREVDADADEARRSERSAIRHDSPVIYRNRQN